MQQLDIFDDSRDRMLANVLAEAVAAAQPDAARAAAAALQAEYPQDRHLAPAMVLIGALEAEQAAAPVWSDAASAMAARHHLEAVLQPAAQDLLGREPAGPWLAARWAALARRARAIAFDADTAPAHAAALCLQAGAWADAAQAVRGIESWRRRPLPLAWMAQAAWRVEGPDSIWPLLAELAWMAPQRLPGLLARLPDRRLQRLAARFEAALGDAQEPDWAWWPAWLLVEQPLLAPALDAAGCAGDADHERGFKLLQALLRLEGQGRHAEVVAHRARLKALHGGLYAAYMAPR